MTEYHTFMRKWNQEEGINSFYGSDKGRFLKDWNEFKIRANPPKAKALAPKEPEVPPEPEGSPPRQQQRNAAEQVFTNPDLLKQIGSFTNPKNYIDDFFDGTEINKTALEDFLLKRGIQLKKRNNIDQYEKLIEILALSTGGLRDIKDTGYIDSRGFGRYSDYNKNLRIPALRKVFANLLEKKLPDINYDKFWRLVSNAVLPYLTEINNIIMTKLFPTWKNKGKRSKPMRDFYDPGMGN